ncbi:MAG: hypothetical protein II832_07880, partial [Synergistaceae bacterium]|nr:hypothetical protein [Synergistaceae bacterium]
KQVYTWWVGYNLDSENSRVKDKLEGRASSANLKGTASNTPPDKSSATAYTSKNHTYVWIQIRSNRR